MVTRQVVDNEYEVANDSSKYENKLQGTYRGFSPTDTYSLS